MNLLNGPIPDDTKLYELIFPALDGLQILIHNGTCITCPKPLFVRKEHFDR